MSGIRERLPGEIVPDRAEDNKGNDAAQAMDLNPKTSPNQALWFIFILDRVYCVEKVIRYKIGGNVKSWNCSATDCSACEGEICSKFTLTVFEEGVSSDNLPSISGCKYGDRVKLLKRSTGFEVGELAVINQGILLRFI